MSRRDSGVTAPRRRLATPRGPVAIAIAAMLAVIPLFLATASPKPSRHPSAQRSAAPLSTPTCLDSSRRALFTTAVWCAAVTSAPAEVDAYAARLGATAAALYQVAVSRG